MTTTNTTTNRDAFYVLNGDGSINKGATRERRLFGPNAKKIRSRRPVISNHPSWNGEPSLKADGSIDKYASRMRRLFGSVN